MKKIQRQSLIRRIITEQPVSTQEELLAKLQEVGVKATQATISRDIREMKLVKSHDENKQVRYALFSQPSETLNEERLKSAVKREVLKIQIVQFMIVVLTEKRWCRCRNGWLR